MHYVPNRTMKRFSIPPSSMSALPSVNNSIVQDLLWISKQQQQHPSIHAHPLKNTIRINSRGIRFKFNGKQWRPLCQSSDGYECRNLAFRSSLCQKHFYKVHLVKRSYAQKNSNSSLQRPGIPPISLKCSLPVKYEQSSSKQVDRIHEQSKEIYEDDENSIEVIENHDTIVNKPDVVRSRSEYSYFSIDDDNDERQSETNTQMKSELSPISYSIRTEETVTHSDSENIESSNQNSKIFESIRLGIPPLTRTEEKSLANELITQLPADTSFIIGEQTARRRVCEIVFDNYSQKLSFGNISIDWFYDFLLRNPRIPIHFQSWFSSVKSTLPHTDHLIDIKTWELGLITRSFISSSSVSTSSP